MAELAARAEHSQTMERVWLQPTFAIKMSAMPGEFQNAKLEKRPECSF
jgi:hypothetical protein